MPADPVEHRQRMANARIERVRQLALTAAADPIKLRRSVQVVRAAVALGRVHLDDLTSDIAAPVGGGRS